MKYFVLGALILFSTAIVAQRPVSAQTQTTKTTTPISIPVTGSGGGNTFAGTFQLQQFATSNGQLVATGLVTGLVTAANGTVTSIVQSVAIPVQVGSNSSCQILHLDLGPLNLNVLGLQISLNQIVLDITAQSGPGNLLGNLLCNVASLLNNPTSLVGVLNQILGAL